jgi:hypothetical protein
VGPDEFEDTAAEFARSVQIVSRLPDQTRVQNLHARGTQSEKPAEPVVVGMCASDISS